MKTYMNKHKDHTRKENSPQRVVCPYGYNQMWECIRAIIFLRELENLSSFIPLNIVHQCTTKQNYKRRLSTHMKEASARKERKEEIWMFVAMFRMLIWTGTKHVMHMLGFRGVENSTITCLLFWTCTINSLVGQWCILNLSTSGIS